VLAAAETVELSAISLGGAARTPWPSENEADGLRGRHDRAVVYETGCGYRSANPVAYGADHLDHSFPVLDQRSYGVPRAQRCSGLGACLVDPDMASLARLCGCGARLVKPHCPEPLVDPGCAFPLATSALVAHPRYLLRYLCQTLREG